MKSPDFAHSLEQQNAFNNSLLDLFTAAAATAWSLMPEESRKGLEVTLQNARDRSCAGLDSETAEAAALPYDRVLELIRAPGNKAL